MKPTAETDYNSKGSLNLNRNRWFKSVQQKRKQANRIIVEKKCPNVSVCHLLSVNRELPIVIGPSNKMICTVIIKGHFS